MFVLFLLGGREASFLSRPSPRAFPVKRIVQILILELLVEEGSKGDKPSLQECIGLPRETILGWKCSPITRRGSRLDPVEKFSSFAW